MRKSDTERENERYAESCGYGKANLDDNRSDREIEAEIDALASGYGPPKKTEK